LRRAAAPPSTLRRQERQENWTKGQWRKGRLCPTYRESCSIGWGPNEEGQRGFFERPNIVGFLELNGPPP